MIQASISWTEGSSWQQVGWHRLLLAYLAYRKRTAISSSGQTRFFHSHSMVAGGLLETS